MLVRNNEKIMRRAARKPPRPDIGDVFGCEICQDVCPSNRRAPIRTKAALTPHHFAPPLEKLAALIEDEFRAMFRDSPVKRAKYTGFLRKVAIAMGNAGDAKFRPALEKLAASSDTVVSEAAHWALRSLAA